jgi:hypothetical protein
MDTPPIGGIGERRGGLASSTNEQSAERVSSPERNIGR